MSREGCVECDENGPSCTRCKIHFFNCKYALDPSPATIALKSFLLQQPHSSLYPDGISPNRLEIDLFGLFRTETVHSICGMLNKSFWSIDVPRAAQTYPALWQASLALAAIYETEKTKTTGNKITSTNNRIPKSHRLNKIKQNRYYIFALSHFHQSLLYLRKL